MREYVKKMLDKFQIKFNDEKKIRTPASTDMFSEDTSKHLTAKDRETMH